MVFFSKQVDNASAAQILEHFCSNGLALSGGFALQFFLPREFIKKQEDDIDFTFFHSGSTKEALERLNKISKGSGLTDFKELFHHSSQQPRRAVFESIFPGRQPVLVHVEATDLRIPTKMERLKAKGLKKKITVLVPDLNYLIARLLFAVSSPTRPWHRRLDDISYLCHLIEFQKNSISKHKTLAYFRKLCGGESIAKQRRANFSEALRITTQREVRERTARVRTRASFDFEKAMKKLVNTFGARGRADPGVSISRKIYFLSRKEKGELARALGVPLSESMIWNAIEPRLSRMHEKEISMLNRTKSQFLKRLRRL